jgi:hypothetical protein
MLTTSSSSAGERNDVEKLGVTFLGLVTVTGAFVVWLFSLIDHSAAAANLQSQLPQDLPYYQQRVDEDPVRIPVVVTSETQMGDSGKATGYEHTELSRAYFVFTGNGF